MARGTRLKGRRHVVAASGFSGALLMGVLFALFSASPPAGAAVTTITVTGTGDAAGNCMGNSCPTLRSAVARANTQTSNSANPIVIQLAAGTTTLTGGVMTIGSSTNLFVTVQGAVSGSPSGSVIAQSTSNGVFTTSGNDANQVVNLTDLTIENAHAGGFGGGALQAGAVALTATGQATTITDCAFINNTATKGGAIVFASGGTLTVNNSTFTSNGATVGTGGAIDFFSDGGHGASHLNISGSTFTNNSITGAINGGANGGAVFYSGGGTASLSVTTSLFSGNSAGSATGSAGEGAGLMISETNGNIDSVTKSTFVNNTAHDGAAGNAAPIGEGGGVWTNNGTLTLSDSRLVGNSASHGPSLWEETNGGSANAADDWWGVNTGPGTNAGGGTGAVLTTSPWLQLRNIPASATLLPGGSTTLTADILGLSTGGSLASGSLNGLASFPATGGVFSNNVDGTLSSTSTQFVNGVATTGFTVGNTLGSPAAHVDARADNQTVTGNVNVKANSSTSVPTNNPSTSVFGQPVTLSATLTSASGATVPAVPQGGTVQFKVDGVNAGSAAAVSNGSASTSFAGMAVGTHTITAVYSGDADFNTSTSPSGVTQTVNKANTAATLTSSLNPSFASQNVTFTVTVTAVSPGAGTPGGTGSVQFEDNGVPLGTAQTPVGGVASISTSSLSVSTHNITAVYAGDANFNGTTGNLAAPGQVVNPAPTSVTVTSSFNPSVFGQPVTFTATVSAVLAGTPGGFVQFGLNGVNLGTGETLVSGKAVTPVLTNLAVGSTNVTATYTPTDGVHAGSSGLVTQTVMKANTSTTIGSTPNPSIAGAPVNFTATVTAVAPGAGTPTGQVQFFRAGSALGSPATLNGSGVATLTGVTSLPVGNNAVTATYTGDTNFNASSSTTLTQVVTAIPTTTTLASSANPSVFGQPVSFTATVGAGANGTPTGNVQFGVDGANAGSPVALSGGTASSGSISTLAVGTHTVTATYVPSGSFAGSSGTLAGGQTVNKAGTTTTLTSSGNPSVFGQPVTITATVAPVAPGAGTPGGSVQFFIDGSAFGGAVTLSGGQGVSGVDSALTVGSHAVTATYTGDTNFNGSTSPTPHQTVVPANANLALTSSRNPTVFGQPVQFSVTATSAAGTPTGSIQFGVNGANFGSPVGLSGGVALSLPDSTLPVGISTVTATYTGDTDFNPGTAILAGGQTVNKANTATTIGSSANPSNAGTPLTFTATVTAVSPGAGTPGGTVDFVIDGGAPMPATLNGSGVATLSGVTLPVASHTVVAAYQGDMNFNPSNSTTLTQVVNGFATTTTLASSANPSVFGQPVSFTATVAAGLNGTPTGQVQFGIDGANAGSPVTLSGGTASSGSIATLAVGTHTVTATYTATGNFAGSSGTLAGGQIVIQAASSTTVGSSANPSAFGQGVNFTATVTAVPPGAGTPGGSVQFFVDGTPFGGAASLTGGVASSGVDSTLAVGSHSVTATYTGDTSFTGSTSPVLDQVVGRVNASFTLTSSVPTSVFGQPVDFTATLTGPAGTPTGSIQFGIGGVNFGAPVALTGGVATSMSTSSLPVGASTVTATYTGDTTYLPGSQTLTQSVNQASTTTTIGSDPNPSTGGSPVTFSATVTAVSPGAGTPGGTVDFVIDGGSPTPATLNGSGVATLSGVTSLTVGSHSVVAEYLGATNFSASNSTTLTQVVNGFATTTTLASSANPSASGQPVSFTATVGAGSNGTPTGQVQFGVDGANTGSPVALSAGTASSTPISTLAVGTHTVTATYLPTGNFAASSGTLAGGQVVSKAGSSTAIGSSANPSALGQGVNFTATVTAVAPGAGTPTGQVHFFVDGSELTPAGSLSSGVGTSASTSSLAAGPHSVTATYSGDSGFLPSTSATFTQVVGQLTPTIGVTSTVNPSLAGQPVAFSATVSGSLGTPTGQVQFGIDGANVGTPVNLAGGAANSGPTSSLAAGSHTVTATYLGNTIYKPATASVNQVVNQASTTTTLSSSDGGTGAAGHPVVYTATVSVTPPGGGIPPGTVAFFGNGSPIAGCGAEPLSATTPDRATCSTTHGLPVGPFTVTATYSGTTSYASSTSAPFTETTTATTTITGNHSGSLTVKAGQTLVIGPGATLNGSITVNPGGLLEIEGSTIRGSITSTGAAGIRLCSSTLSGAVSITRSTGLVVVGDDEGSPACGGNTIIGGVTITKNTAGVEFDHNTVAGAVIITGNTGSVPPPDTGPVVAVDNTFNAGATIQ